MRENVIDKGTSPESQPGTDVKIPLGVTETTVPDLNELPAESECSLPPPPALSAAEEKKLYRKLDVRLMPIYTLMYLCGFLDRGMLFSAAD